MSTLSYQTLIRRLPELIDEEHRDPALVNSASIDIRIGRSLLKEGDEEPWDLGHYTRENPFYLAPNQFVLVDTLERFMVPLDLCMEMFLKSTTARGGYDHSHAFWFDPGWDGIGTMEIKNLNERTFRPLYPGMRFAQIVYRMLDEPSQKPYAGRYQNATGVEPAKPELKT